MKSAISQGQNEVGAGGAVSRCQSVGTPEMERRSVETGDKERALDDRCIQITDP